MSFTLLEKNFSLAIEIESSDKTDLVELKTQLLECIAVQDYLLARGSNDEKVNDQIRILNHKIKNHQYL